MVLGVCVPSSLIARWSPCVSLQGLRDSIVTSWLETNSGAAAGKITINKIKQNKWSLGPWAAMAELFRNHQLSKKKKKKVRGKSEGGFDRKIDRPDDLRVVRVGERGGSGKWPWIHCGRSFGINRCSSFLFSSHPNESKQKKLFNFDFRPFVYRKGLKGGRNEQIQMQTLCGN
jgi:hypothetical protein